VYLYTYYWVVVLLLFNVNFLFTLEYTAYALSDYKLRHDFTVSTVQVQRTASSCVLTNHLLQSLSIVM